MGAVIETIRRKLQADFSPLRLEVVDESSKHHGHAGARPEGETHFDVLVESAAFQGQSRVLRQRAVYAALREELAGPVHALSVTALAPGETR